MLYIKDEVAVNYGIVYLIKDEAVVSYGTEQWCCMML